MPLSKEEINKLKCIFASRKKALSVLAVCQLVPFTSAHLCETGLSNYAATKRKYRNGLNAAPDLRSQLYIIKQNIKNCEQRERKTSLRIETCRCVAL
jgi:hypothetical protein